MTADRWCALSTRSTFFWASACSLDDCFILPLGSSHDHFSLSHFKARSEKQELALEYLENINSMKSEIFIFH